MRRASIHALGARPRGIATLTVVMVLFFIMAMVAAYTNRNLLFEQRTSVNSYRATQSLLAAEAGVDWMIAQINGGIINASCVGGNDATTDFRWRYFELRFDGSLAGRKWPNPNMLNVPETGHPACVLSPSGPQCSCPTGPNSTLPMVSSDAPSVFVLRLLTDSLSGTPGVTRPGALRIQSNGCSSALAGVTSATMNDLNSCHINRTTPQVDSSMAVELTLGLVSALPVPPAAAITTGGSITQTSGTLRATNEDAKTGVTLHAGAGISGTTSLRGPAGSATNTSQASDSALSGLTATAGDFFRATFGMPPETFRQQPAAVRVSCPGGCTWADLEPVLAKNPSRVIYLDGNLTLDQTTNIGSAALPAMLVSSGHVTISAPITMVGVIYSEGNIAWQSSAAGGLVRGALVSVGNFEGEGTVAVAYDADAIWRIHHAYGSFVRVPGSWRTF